MDNNIKVIAFYLPQFHPTTNNDRWWGKGFTEWTNVGKARPLFYGHEQPKVPADLGYYDLRVPEVREDQARLAKEAGIEGFCYYHYWFSEEHQELDLPFKEVLETGKPDFPFCLCWANESWNKKFWNPDGTFDREVLAEQKYESPAANERHFYRLLDAFKDTRYIKVEGKPLFMIYKPLDFKNIESLIKQWNKLAEDNGLPGVYFVGHTYAPSSVDSILALGFDGVSVTRTWEPLRETYDKCSLPLYIYRRMVKKLFNRPFVIPYKTAIKFLIGEEGCRENVYPSIIPNWDHTPRSKTGGFLFSKSTPALFAKHVTSVLNQIINKKQNNRIVFLKSWNEWGEGNYLEPDLKWGKEYIKVLRDCLENYNK